MNMAYYRTHVLLAAIFLNSFATTADSANSLDSLEALIIYQLSFQTTADTSTVNLINEYAKRLLKPDISRSHSYALKGITLASEISYVKGEAVARQAMGDVYRAQNQFDKAIESYNKSSVLFESSQLFSQQGYVLGEIGNIYRNTGSYESALKYHFSSATAKESSKDSIGLGYTYDLIGAIYSDQTMYDQALEYHNKAAKIKEEIKNDKGLAFTLDQIGRIYRHKELYDKALTYHLKASGIKMEIGNDKGLAYTYDQIGRTYRAQGNYDLALEFHEKASEIKERIGNRKGLAYTFDHIGKIYLDMEKPQLAIAYQIKAAEIKKEIGNMSGLAISLLNIGHSYIAYKKYRKAIQYLTDALEQAKAVESKTIIRDVYLELSKCYRQMGEFETSLKFFSSYSDIKDTILSGEGIRQIAEMQTKYGTEKKEKELLISDLELKKKKAELKTSKIILGSFALGFILILVLSVVVYRNLREKKKANLLLEEKNHAITKQSEIIESRNKKITDSIDYAKRIQEALLANRSNLSNYFEESFLLHKPKDVVSGDFFWIKQMDETILFAVADCTGHGVPGAFMSIICNNILNEISSSLESVLPGNILKATNNELIKRMQPKQANGDVSAQTTSWQVKDGMDIALCSLNKKSLVLHYAGAHNPLYLLRNGDLIETKADKAFIGSQPDIEFTNHEIPLESGDFLYLFTDGFADQRGGPSDKKFYYQPFQDMLQQIHQTETDEQRTHLDNVVTDWIGGNEQIDDIIVFGLKVA